MLIPRVVPTSIAGKGASKIKLGHAIAASLFIFALLVGLWYTAMSGMAPDKDAEARALYRRQVEAQFDKTSTDYYRIFSLGTRSAPIGWPAAMPGKIAVLTATGSLHPLHWELPIESQAGLPDQIKSVIFIHYKPEVPGVAARLWFYDAQKKAWLGMLDIKRTAEMSGSVEHTLINGAISDLMWSHFEKKG